MIYIYITIYIYLYLYFDINQRKLGSNTSELRIFYLMKGGARSNNTSCVNTSEKN